MKKILSILLVGAFLILLLPNVVASEATTPWAVSKSDHAENLDKNFESKVSVSLPSAQEAIGSDVVFVLDKSTSGTTGDAKNAINEMVDRLSEMVKVEKISLKVGVVLCNYYPVAELGLTELNEDNLKTIQDAVTKEYKHGSNTYTGLVLADEMLKKDTKVPDSKKYIIYLTDGIGYYWTDAEGNAQSIFYSDMDIPTNNYVSSPSQEDIKAKNGTVPTFEDILKWDPATVEGWNNDLPARDKDGAIIRQYDYGTLNDDMMSKIVTPDKSKVDVTSYEKSIYLSAKKYQELAKKYHITSVYWKTPNCSYYSIAYDFMKWTADPNGGGGTGYDITKKSSDDNSDENSDVYYSVEDAFEGIENTLLYLVDSGSIVYDEIGGNDDYDFNFVNDLDKMQITVGGKALDKKKIDMSIFQTDDEDESDIFDKIGGAYGFGAMGENEYQFILVYFPDGFKGEEHECFLWLINVPISNFAPVQLDYSVKLMNPKDKAGEYGKYDGDGVSHFDNLFPANKIELYPMDSEEHKGLPEEFNKPTVSYTVEEIIPDDNTPHTEPTDKPEVKPAETIQDNPVPKAPATGAQSEIPEILLVVAALSASVVLAGIARKKRTEK